MSLQQVPTPCICLITDHSVCTDGLGGLEGAVAAALAGGLNAVQLREKSVPTRQLYDLGVQLRQLTADAGAILFVNDRVDLALAIGADGVHLGTGSLPAPQVRRLLGGRPIGCSVHSVAEACAAEGEGADYLIAGTIFPSASHPGQPAHGPRLVREIARTVKLPLLGIGGITAENAAQVIAAGAIGVAVIREILGSPEPEGAARRLVERVMAAYTKRARFHSTCN